jgi:hypothetical protein
MKCAFVLASEQSRQYARVSQEECKSADSGVCLLRTAAEFEVDGRSVEHTYM